MSIFPVGQERGWFLVSPWVEAFRETGNPLYAWRAYQNARRLGCPIPEEVLSYLDGAADRLVQLATKTPSAKVRAQQTDRERAQTAKERAQAVSKAVGLGKAGKGPGSAFTDYADHRRQLTIAMEAFEQIEKGATEYAVFIEIGETHGVSDSTARRYYQDALNRWDRMLKTLIDNEVISFVDGKVKISATVFGNAADFREAAILLTIIKKRLPK